MLYIKLLRINCKNIILFFLYLFKNKNLLKNERDMPLQKLRILKNSWSMIRCKFSEFYFYNTHCLWLYTDEWNKYTIDALSSVNRLHHQVQNSSRISNRKPEQEVVTDDGRRYETCGKKNRPFLLYPKWPLRFNSDLLFHLAPSVRAPTN